MPTNGSGIICAGTIVTDYVVVVDRWPAESSLANIRRQQKTGGGGAFNVIKDLRAMDPDVPLSLIGLLGNDDNGRWLIDVCRLSKIDTKQLKICVDETPTSYTYVISVESTGKRTFFNQRGSNALINESHFDFSQFVDLDCYKIFYLGYLTLFDQLDKIVDEETGAGKVLKRAKQFGLQTVVDFVSVQNPFYSEISRLTLPHVDHLILNEIEIGLILNRSFENETVEQIEEAGRILLEEYGVQQTVTIHFERGAVCLNRRDKTSIDVYRQGSFSLPQSWIRGAVGAGDAFAAGIIYGISKNFSIEKRLIYGICVSAQSLTSETAYDGVRSIDECLNLKNRFEFRLLEKSSKLSVD